MIREFKFEMKRFIKRLFPTARYRMPQINFLRLRGTTIPRSAAYKLFCTDEEFDWLIKIAVTYGLNERDRGFFYRRFYE